MMEVKEDEMGIPCGMHGREGDCIQGFGGKRPPGIPKHRWVYNIKMGHREIG
jgi:hypothetical protein